MNVVTEANQTSFSDSLLKESGAAYQPAQTTPETKPAEAPAEKPVETITEKPVETTTDKPAEPTTPITTTTTKAPASQPEGDESDIDDEKLLAALRKKTGRDFKSLDEFTADRKEPTEDEKKQAAETERSEAIEFGKVNKLFSQADYDKFITFSAKDPSDAVQERFVARAIEADKNLTPEEAQDLFNEVFHIMEPEDSYKFQEGQRMIQKEYEDEKNKEFANIAGVTGLYKDYKENTAKAQAYSSEVSKLFTPEKLPTKFEFPIDGEIISFPVDLKNKQVIDILDNIKKDYLTVDMMRSSTDRTGKLNEQGLAAQINLDLQQALVKEIVTEVAKSYSAAVLVKAKLGRRGVININEETSSGATGSASGPLGYSDQLLKESGYPVETAK